MLAILQLLVKQPLELTPLGGLVDCTTASTLFSSWDQSVGLDPFCVELAGSPFFLNWFS